MKNIATLIASLTLSITAFVPGAAQVRSGSTARRTNARPAPSSSAQLQEMSTQIQHLRDMLLQQQRRIDDLSQQLRQRDQSVAQAQSVASDAVATATEARSAATQNASSFSTLRTDVSDLKANVSSTVASVQEDQKKLRESIESPVAIHYKGVTITPGGFLAAESVYHSHGLLSDVNTPFNSIPFNGS